ncbi:hypothetical protein J3E69DRAFT_104325 [Trichoderma sp. SZMC 28015]
MEIESSGRLSACGVSRWPTGARCGASPGRAEYIGELAFYPRLVWLLGFCPALVASLALSIRFPICWRWVIVELQAGPMHWQGTRTVLYTSVAVPAQCLHASSAASNRTDRIGGDENFFHHGSGWPKGQPRNLAGVADWVVVGSRIVPRGQADRAIGPLPASAMQASSFSH